MSLREEIADTIYLYGTKAANGVVTSSDYEAKMLINKVLDAAVEVVKEARQQMWKDAFASKFPKAGFEGAIEAINKLREGSDNE